ncbi:protein argonaute 14 isoform X1 [Triticum aestivum]|uniref:protein argonaute 14 isoform X1 n=1 Tax=Triticum aestivum TaxID=4565 RepID=UPI001D02F543|nr:protein argonaute 14-like isoform X1 [Triticum aestivum]
MAAPPHARRTWRHRGRNALRRPTPRRLKAGPLVITDGGPSGQPTPPGGQQQRAGTAGGGGGVALLHPASRSSPSATSAQRGRSRWRGGLSGRGDGQGGGRRARRRAGGCRRGEGRGGRGEGGGGAAVAPSFARAKFKLHPPPYVHLGEECEHPEYIIRGPPPAIQYCGELEKYCHWGNEVKLYQHHVNTLFAMFRRKKADIKYYVCTINKTFSKPGQRVYFQVYYTEKT